MIKEFREFALKGNVMDLAVGVIIGAAFGKIVDSIVGDLIMPIVGKLIGGVTAIGVAMLLVPKDENVPAAAKTEAEAQS